MVSRDITERQKEILKFVYQSISSNGFPPTFEDFNNKFGFKSNQAIIDHLVALEKKNLIRREDNSARGIQITRLGFKQLKKRPMIPVAGASYAGTFTETFQLQGTWEQLSGNIKKFSNPVFVIEVFGDSMINAGIYESDKLLVQEQEHFKSGDIVLAQSPEGTTVKRFIRQNKPPFIFLKPENPKYKHISFTEEVKMQGKIIGKLVTNHWQQLIQGRFL